MKSKKMTLLIIITLVCALILWIGIDVIINLTYNKLPDRPESDEGSGLVHQLLFYLLYPAEADADGITIDDEYIISAIAPAKKYIDGRYDCLDFRMQSLMRLQYLYGDVIENISPDGAEMIKQAFINAKYWMTEPGEDSVCYWSENHQILFATAEYLAGQMWPDEIFTNDGSTGQERMTRGRNRINYWMEHRFLYGFSEINSNNYYHFNFGAASNFIQFASPEDSDMVEHMRMCVDLVIYDVASNIHNYTFLAPSGRAYVDNMASVAGDRMRQYVDYLWGFNDNHKRSTHHMLINFVSMMESVDEYGNKYYEVPEVLLEIGRDNSKRIIKSSSSLNVSELKERNLIGHSDEQIMMQLGMESFTNPEVIHNTITYLSKNKMLRNSFVNEFRYVNLSFLKTFRLLGPISRKLNPMPNGIALERANIYSYQNEYYKLATNQAYHPGSYGAQQMLSIACLTEYANVFTTHPARYESARNVTATPGYWAGYGRAPHSAQDENILMSIYQLPKKKNVTEFYDVPDFTHTYFPEAFMDEVVIEGKYAFGRAGGAYIALIGNSDLEYLDYSEISAKAFRNGLEDYPDKRFDLVQRGLNQFWIYEMSDENNESFSQFMSRIKSNTISYDNKGKLVYTSNSKVLSLEYKGDFKVNNIVLDLEYKRFDSEYIVAEREAEELVFLYNGYTLTLNYKDIIRHIS